VALLGLMKVGGLAVSRNDAGALLLVILWGCVSARLGVRISQGPNHLAANVVVSAVLLGAYQLATSI
jgi:hypothetical protein